MSCGQNDAVGKGYLQFCADLSCPQGDAFAQRVNLPLMHYGNSMKCGILSSLLHDPFTYFKDADGWDKDRACILYGRCIEVSV